jgi:predicted component of type VI protein secretion system
MQTLLAFATSGIQKQINSREFRFFGHEAQGCMVPKFDLDQSAENECSILAKQRQVSALS